MINSHLKPNKDLRSMSKVLPLTSRDLQLMTNNRRPTTRLLNKRPTTRIHPLKALLMLERQPMKSQRATPKTTPSPRYASTQ